MQWLPHGYDDMVHLLLKPRAEAAKGEHHNWITTSKPCSDWVNEQSALGFEY